MTQVMPTNVAAIMPEADRPSEQVRLRSLLYSKGHPQQQQQEQRQQQFAAAPTKSHQPQGQQQQFCVHDAINRFTQPKKQTTENNKIDTNNKPGQEVNRTAAAAAAAAAPPAAAMAAAVAEARQHHHIHHYHRHNHHHYNEKQHHGHHHHHDGHHEETECSSDELEELAEVAPTHDALAKFNARHGHTWVDFSTTPHSDESDVPKEGKDESKTAKGGHHRLHSWLDLDEDEFDDELALDYYGGEVQAKKEVKKVEFGGPAYNTHINHIARSDMTEEEMHHCWFDEYDHEDIQIDIIETVRSIRRSNRLSASRGKGGQQRLPNDGNGKQDMNVPCARGIEHVVDPNLLEERKHMKDDCLEAVLTEQEAIRILIDGGHDVPDGWALIGEASREASKSSVERAVAFARNDAAVARMILTRNTRSQVGMRGLMDRLRVSLEQEA